MSSLTRIYALNAANMLSLIVAQVAIVPFYLHYLGVKGYESWMFINAIAGICLMCDFGVTYYISNTARIAYGQGNTQAAEKIINQGLSFITFLFIPFTAVSVLYYRFHATTEGLALAIVLFSTPISILRTFSYYTLTARTTQTGELAVSIGFMLMLTALLITVVILGGGLCELAITQTIATALFGVLPTLLILRRAAPELRLRPRRIPAHELRAVVAGSLSQFSYSATAMTIVYLPVILLGIIPGLPQGSIATFTTSRTLTGVVRQFCQQLARSNGIEISRYLAPEHAERKLRIFLLGSATISVLVALGMGGLWPVADLVLKVWTGKPELYNPAVIGIFCITAVLSAQVQLPMILPLFTNAARMMVLPLAIQVFLLVVLGLTAAALFAAPGMVATLGFAEISTLGVVSLIRIVPSMGISSTRFLALCVLPSFGIFALSALASLTARKLIHPENFYGLVACGAIWTIFISPLALYLYKAGKRWQPQRVNGNVH